MSETDTLGGIGMQRHTDTDPAVIWSEAFSINLGLRKESIILMYGP